MNQLKTLEGIMPFPPQEVVRGTVLQPVTVFSSRRTCSSTPSSRNSSRTSLITSSITDLYSLGCGAPMKEKKKQNIHILQHCLAGLLWPVEVMVNRTEGIVYIANWKYNNYIIIIIYYNYHYNHNYFISNDDKKYNQICLNCTVSKLPKQSTF